jgi:hypothetical protein
VDAIRGHQLAGRDRRPVAAELHHIAGWGHRAVVLFPPVEVSGTAVVVARAEDGTELARDTVELLPPPG